MNTVQWVCRECDTKNVVVLKDGENNLYCRDCGQSVDLVELTEVVVYRYDEVTIHTGG